MNHWLKVYISQIIDVSLLHSIVGIFCMTNLIV